MRRALLVLLGVCATGAGALVLAAAADERRTAFAPVPRSVAVVAVTAPGQTVCQREVDVPAAFDGVETSVGTGGVPSPPVDVEVRRSGGTRVLARGRLPAGARDNTAALAQVRPEVRSGQVVDVCMRNAGRRELAFYGGPWFASPGRADVEGRRAEGNLQLRYVRSEPRSALSLVPDMFRRAALFRPEPFGLRLDEAFA